MKSPDFDENMILPDVPCGHFALGTLSETCFKDAVFDVNVRRQKVIQISKKQTCQIWHENQKSYHNQILVCLNWDILIHDLRKHLMKNAIHEVGAA